MKKMLMPLVMLASLLGLSNRLQAQETVKPLVVVAFSGYDSLIKDLDYVGQLSGKPDLAKNMEGVLTFFTQGQGLAGLDKTRPWGALVATDGATFPKAIYLPVSDVEKLMGALVAFIGVPQDAGDGIWQVEVQANQMPLFLKAEDGWARIGQQPEDIKAMPKDPLPLLGGLEKQYDIAVRALMKNIPEELKQLGLGYLQKGLNDSLQPMENEEDEAFQQRKKLAEQQMQTMVQQFNDLEHFTVGVSIDQPGKKVFVDFGMTAVAGSKMAGQIAQLKDLKSQYNGFFQPNGLISLSTASKFSPEDAQASRQQLDAARAQITKELEKSDEFPSEEAKAAVTSLVGDVFNIANSMFDSGKTDLAASVTGKGPFTLVAGGHVGENAKLTEFVDKIANIAKIEGALVAHEKDVATVDEVAFHKLVLNAPTGDDAEKVARLLGPGNIELFFGVGKDRLYIGAGSDALKAVQAAMEQSKANADAPVTPMNLSISLAAVLKAAGYVDDANAELALLGGMLEQAGNDKVRLTYQTSENSVTTRLEAQEGVIQALGKIGAQRQAKDAGL